MNRLNQAVSVTFLIFLSLFVQANNTVEVQYEQANNDLERATKADIIRWGTADSVVSLINHNFELAWPVVIVFGAEDGPLYDGDSHQILMPYGFIDEVKERFAQVNYQKSGVSIEDATQDALMHTLLHEFAHAIIHMYRLPVLGKEEDAADALATVLLIEFYQDGQVIALSAADLFDIESDDRNVLEDQDFWGEHSLDDQRYFSTLCHVYGSDPEVYSSIREEQILSDERADLCIEEYQVVSDSWFQVLEPYLKDRKDR